MVIDASPASRGERHVGQHHIEFMFRKVRRQLLGTPFPADDPYRLAELQGRRDQPLRNHFWEYVHYTDQESQGPSRGPVLYRLGQLPAQRENLAAIAENHTPDFRQDQIATGADKQLLPQTLFEATQLSADGGRRNMQLRAGLADAA
jgi:hypothetical protein